MEKNNKHHIHYFVFLSLMLHAQLVFSWKIKEKNPVTKIIGKQQQVNINLVSAQVKITKKKKAIPKTKKKKNKKIKQKQKEKEKEKEKKQIPKTSTPTFISGNEGKNAYLTKVRKAIESNRVYPLRARRQEIQGTTLIELVIKKNGLIHLLNIKKSSGKNILDKAAMSSITDSAPFEKLPKALKKNILRLLIPIEFSIKD